MKDIRKLTKNEIDVKVKQVTANGTALLLYKTARVDMDILDETFGADTWQSDYKEIKGNLYAGIGVRDEKGEWVWKWDCGIESRTDSDGNQKKGEASDAFKRAGFKWGIGRELYTSPFIFIISDALEVVPKGGGYALKNPFEKFAVSHIAYNANCEISELIISGKGGRKLWSYPANIKPAEPITDEQIKELMALSVDFHKLAEYCGVDTINDLTFKQAADAIAAKKKSIKKENENAVN